jgi:hypothetical protein
VSETLLSSLSSSKIFHFFKIDFKLGFGHFVANKANLIPRWVLVESKFFSIEHSFSVRLYF